MMECCIGKMSEKKDTNNCCSEQLEMFCKNSEKSEDLNDCLKVIGEWFKEFKEKGGSNEKF